MRSSTIASNADRLDLERCRHVGQAQANRFGRARLEDRARSETPLWCRCAWVDRGRVVVDQVAAEGVLDERPRILHAERALVVGFVFGVEDAVRVAVADQPAPAERRMLRRPSRRWSRPASPIVGLGDAGAPRPLVAKPQRRQHVQRRAVLPRLVIVRRMRMSSVVALAYSITMSKYASSAKTPVSTSSYSGCDSSRVARFRCAESS